MKPYKPILLILLCFIMVGCSASQKDNMLSDDSPFESFLAETKFKSVDMNVELRLQFFENENLQINNMFTIGTDINFVLRNESDSDVWFFSQEGIEIFMFKDGKYIRVDDQVDRYLADPIVLISGFELPFRVRPNIQSEEPVDIVVVATGKIMDGDQITSEMVAAYLECTLAP